MTTRKSVAAALHFRRTLLEACLRNNSSLHLAPSWELSIVCPGSRAFTPIGEQQRFFGRCPSFDIPVRHGYKFPKAVSPNSTFSTHKSKPAKECKWIPTIVSETFGVPRPFYRQTPENRGDDASISEREEFYSTEYRDPQRHRLESQILGSNVFCSTTLVGNKSLYHRLVQLRHHSLSPIVEGGRWMRITGTYIGPLASASVRQPFLEGSVRFKSKKKIKKARAKKKETLQKIKRMRVVSKKRKEDMTPDERLEFRIQKGSRKMELIQQAIAKFPVQEIPPEDPDVEVLTPEQLHYLKKIGYKNKNYVPVGRRGIYGGTIQNIHMHWKKHETVQVEIAGFTKEEIAVMAVQLARLSGGLVIDIHQRNIVILYRGRNYKQPKVLIPMKTLDKRKALAKSKLEQSFKALEENNKKLVKELATLRKENALRESGEFVEDRDEGRNELSNIRRFDSDLRLVDPDDFSEVILGDDDSDLENSLDLSELSSFSSEGEEDDSDSDADVDSAIDTVDVEVDEVDNDEVDNAVGK